MIYFKSENRSENPRVLYKARTIRTAKISVLMLFHIKTNRRTVRAYLINKAFNVKITKNGQCVHFMVRA
jgi:hypothetical protein